MGHKQTGGYLPLAGGTISGVLKVDEATGTNNQIHYTQSGKDAWSVGSDVNAATGGNFVISRFDTTGTYVDVPLFINRTSGIVTIGKGAAVSGTLTVTGTSSLDNGTITTNGSGVVSAQGIVLPTARAVHFGTASVYQDSTATNDLVLQANSKYAILDSSGNFTTSNGSLVGAVNVTAGGSVISNGGNITANGAVGTARGINFTTNGVMRWNVVASVSSESGSNVGSDLNFHNFDDSGAMLSTPITIVRSTGQVTINTSLVVPTMASTDNSQNAASTAYVQGVAGTLQTNINNEASARASAITGLQNTKANLSGGNSFTGRQTVTGAIINNINSSFIPVSTVSGYCSNIYCDPTTGNFVVGVNEWVDNNVGTNHAWMSLDHYGNIRTNLGLAVIAGQNAEWGTITGGYYTKLGNVLMQSFSTTGNNNAWITLPMAFSNASYQVYIECIHDDGSYHATGYVAKQTGQFQLALGWLNTSYSNVGDESTVKSLDVIVIGVV